MSSSDSSATSSASSPSGGYLKREALIGKSVVSKNAEIIGSVRDIAVSMDGKVAIQVEKKAGGESSEDLFIGSDEIQAVADVVLLKTACEMAGKGMPVQITNSSPAPVLVSSSSTPQVAPPPYLGAGSVQGKTCSKCGYVNSASSRFCIKCGEKLS